MDQAIPHDERGDPMYCPRSSCDMGPVVPWAGALMTLVEPARPSQGTSALDMRTTCAGPGDGPYKPLPASPACAHAGGRPAFASMTDAAHAMNVWTQSGRSLASGDAAGAPVHCWSTVVTSASL
jgi:hypothetical protein